MPGSLRLHASCPFVPGSDKAFLIGACHKPTHRLPKLKSQPIKGQNALVPEASMQAKCLVRRDVCEQQSTQRPWRSRKNSSGTRDSGAKSGGIRQVLFFVGQGGLGTSALSKRKVKRRRNCRLLLPAFFATCLTCALKLHKLETLLPRSV